MIDLYIEGEHIDLENDVEIDVTYDSFDTQKITAVKNSYSKTLNIPGTPNNNKVFGHIFRNDSNIPGFITGHYDYENAYTSLGIPKEYTLLEYIDSTGLEHIKTNYFPNQDTRLKMKYMLLSNPTIPGSQMVVGCTSSAQTTDARNGLTRIHRGSGYSFNRVGFGNGSGTTANISKYNSYNEEYTLYFNKNDIYINDNHIVTLPTPHTTWTASYETYIFARNTAGNPRYPAKMRFWDCKIWDDETLAQHWVPVKRDSDNKVGLYDVVNKVFKTNGASSGAFIAGPIISKPVYPINSNYDPHRRINWILNQNGSLVNRGYCTLDNIVVEENNKKVTYKLTLYGGLGEFLYSLQYNEDGTSKTLADMYYQWCPKYNLGTTNTPMTQYEEDNNVIYKCLPPIVASSWHKLKPTNAYSGPTNVDTDIIFVPVYTGTYNDFDSKHMIVTTDNQTLPGASVFLSADNRTKLVSTFPDQIQVTTTENEQEVTHTYKTITRDLEISGGSRYGIVTFSRDLDPSEAGDMRLNDLPVAIRLAKLMNVISQPENNGGYEVEWDSTITESDYWTYGWIILGKLNFEKNITRSYNLNPEATVNGRNIEFNYAYDPEHLNLYGEEGVYLNVNQFQSQALNAQSDIPQLLSGNYVIKLNVLPKFTVTGKYIAPEMGTTTTFGQLALSSSISSAIRQRSIVQLNGLVENVYQYIWTTFAIVHVISSGPPNNRTINTVYCDVIYFTNDPNDQFGLNSDGYNQQDIIENLRETLSEELSTITEGYGIDPENFAMHTCKCSPVADGNSIWEVGHFYNPSDANSPWVIDYECENVEMNLHFNAASDLDNVVVEEYQFVTYTQLARYLEYDTMNGPYVESGLWGINGYMNDQSLYEFYDPTHRIESWLHPFGQVYKTMFCLKGYAYPEYNDMASEYLPFFNFSISFNETKLNQFIAQDSINKSNFDLTKKLLFANTSAPIKYLLDFCKMLNLKMISDHVNKKIFIENIKSFYNKDISEAIVDYARPIEIKTVLNDYRTLKFGLETPDTYAVDTFNKSNLNKFNFKEFDTGIEYISQNKELLKDLIFKNTMDWQLSSIFYNNYPQLPHAYATPTVSWTLFDADLLNNSELVKKEFIQTGTDFVEQKNLYNTLDYVPKLSMFNNEGKTMDIKDTFVFLSGFIKNYDYTLYNQVPTSEGRSTKYYSITPRNLLTSDTTEQYLLNGQRCYEWNFCFADTFTNWGCYSSSNNDYAGAWVLPHFSRDLRVLYGETFGTGTTPTWGVQNNEYTSWNIIKQNELYDIVDYSRIKFLVNNLDATDAFPRIWIDEDRLDIYPPLWKMNERSLAFPFDKNETDNSIFRRHWSDYLDEIYNKNARETTLYLDLTKFSSPNDVLRTIFEWEGQYWAVKKIFNYKTSDIHKDRFTKVTLFRITKLNNWI